DEVVKQARHAEASRRTVELKRRALEMGFDAVGVASLEPNAHAGELDHWLAAGYAGTMTYLHRQAAQRKEPARIMPGATAAVVTLTNYRHDPGPPAQGQPRVAQYAQSADYHRVLGHRLERLANTIRELVPGSHTRPCVPSLTLEPRADFTAAERSLVGDGLFGCDVCQDVCPWNVRFARATTDPALAPRADLVAPDPHESLELDEEAFARRYGDTPFERPGRGGMRRNAAAALARKAP